MLQLEGVELDQGDFRLTADWALNPGERAAVIGPSGAGKSTLLMAIAGFLAPKQGRITWQGQDLAPLTPGDRPVSILFQDQNVFPHLTLGQGSAELYIACAEHDELAPLPMVDELRALFEASGARGELEVYPAVHHGFAFPGRWCFDKPGAERHWERLIALYRRCFG